MRARPRRCPSPTRASTRHGAPHAAPLERLARGLCRAAAGRPRAGGAVHVGPGVTRADLAGPRVHPEHARRPRAGFASIAEQAAALGAVEVVPVPWDCRDGFFSAFWRRPEAYLDPKVREGISVAHRSDAELAEGLARLRADLASGAWARRHADLLGAKSSTWDTACSSAPACGRQARAAGIGSADLFLSRGAHAAAEVVASSRRARQQAGRRRASPRAKRANSSRQPAAKTPRRARRTPPSAAAAANAARRAGGGRRQADEAARANLAALRDALRKGVVLTADGVKEALDDAVKRGRITRKDATELSQTPARRRARAGRRLPRRPRAAARPRPLAGGAVQRPRRCARSTARAARVGVGPRSRSRSTTS